MAFMVAPHIVSLITLALSLVVAWIWARRKPSDKSIGVEIVGRLLLGIFIFFPVRGIYCLAMEGAFFEQVFIEGLVAGFLLFTSWVVFGNQDKPLWKKAKDAQLAIYIVPCFIVGVDCAFSAGHF